MDWIYAPLYELLYTVQRMIASVGWGFDRSILYVVELIERFRLQLVTAGFRPAVQTVADEVLGISRSTLKLGLILGLLLIILQPVLITRFVNVRKVFVLLLVVPLLLPFGGAIFQDIEQARSDLGQALFEQIFNGSQFDLLPADEERTGADREMGPLVTYTPGSTALHGIDVAAAYLYAVRADVMRPNSPPPADLPDAFAEQYFPYSAEALRNLDDSEREQAIELAGQGIIRTFYGGLMVLFALGESVTNLIFTIGLGLLLIGLLISLVFGWAAPVEHITANLTRKICELILVSWGLSAIQGLLLAAIIDVATSSNAIATLGMGCLGMVMEAGFAFLASKTLAGALIGVAGAGSAGGISEGDARRGAQTVAGAARTAVSGGAAAVAGAGGAVLGAGGAALRSAAKTAGGAYLAKHQGASTGYAIGYALSHSKTFARAGALAQAMGAASPESEVIQGLYTGHVIGRGEIGSLRSQRALRRDIEQQHRQRETAAEQEQQEQQAFFTLATARLLKRRHQAWQHRRATARERRFRTYVRTNAARHAWTRWRSDPTTQQAYARAQQRDRWHGAQTGMPFRGTVYQGRGATPEQVYGAAAVQDGLASPAFGPGQYYAPTSDLAARYGDGVSEQQVQLGYPLVLDSDSAFMEVLTAAGAQALDPRGAAVWTDPGAVELAKVRLQNHLQHQGYDGLIVRIDHDETDTVRRMRNIASHDQVVVFPPLPLADQIHARANAPDRVVTPSVYTRLTPEQPEERVVRATADLQTQYQAQRKTTDAPPTGPRSVTRPRRRGPIPTTKPKKERP